VRSTLTIDHSQCGGVLDAPWRARAVRGVRNLQRRVSVKSGVFGQVRPGAAPLAKRQAAINRCFAADNVGTILDALQHEAAGGGPDAEWAADTRAGLLTKSPTSLKITLRQLVTGRGYAIEDALALEYRLTQHVMAGHDFYEGVRAVVVDKDQKPRWEYASVAEIGEQEVARYFESLGERELVFD